MMAKKKLFITGASGFLGWNLCMLLAEHYQIVGTYFRNQFDHDQLEWERINLLETKQLKELVQKVKPDLIVHLAAISNTSFCEQHPALSHHINVYTTVTLAESAKELEIPILYTSTDLVFNGNNPPYDEFNFPYPLMMYGEQKLAAEDALLDSYDRVLVCRLPLMFGWAADYHSNFFIDWYQKLKNGEPIHAFIDEYRTPISGTVASEWLHKAIQYLLAMDKPTESLLNMGGMERISRYDFAIQMAKVFELPDNTIEATSLADVELAAPRPKDVSMDNQLARELLNYTPPSIQKQLLSLRKKIS
ncbi:MAG: NAD(P)-dependent oxidoreductase [Aureispira sp.]|nr:NAD(P)-dependent oxidoreductase [Aureispira sp.]